MDTDKCVERVHLRFRRRGGLLGGRAVIGEFEVTGGCVAKMFELGAALSERVERRVIMYAAVRLYVVAETRPGTRVSVGAACCRRAASGGYLRSKMAGI